MRITPVLVVSLVACSDSASPPPPADVEFTQLDLRVAMDEPTADPVGVTVAPDTGEVYVLDSALGLYRQNGDRFERVVEPGVLYQVAPASAFTDVAAIGGDQFTLTAMNDGFKFDLATGVIAQHFCYVPGFIIPGPPVVVQMTLSVAWNPVTRRIIAQPVTVQASTGVSQSADVGTFPETGGEGDDWHPIPDPNFLAGGMTVGPRGELWLGRGDELFVYDLATDTLRFERSLAAFEIREVAGMAVDGDDLLIVDQRTKLLTRVPLSQL